MNSIYLSHSFLMIFVNVYLGQPLSFISDYKLHSAAFFLYFLSFPKQNTVLYSRLFKKIFFEISIKRVRIINLINLICFFRLIIDFSYHFHQIEKYFSFFRCSKIVLQSCIVLLKCVYDVSKERKRYKVIYSTLQNAR